VRRTLGEQVRRGPGRRASAAAGAGVPGFADDLDSGRADAVLPVLRLLLGLDGDDDGRANTDDDLVGVAG
jgi:hypothetical protein